MKDGGSYKDVITYTWMMGLLRSVVISQKVKKVVGKRGEEMRRCSFFFMHPRISRMNLAVSHAILRDSYGWGACQMARSDRRHQSSPSSFLSASWLDDLLERWIRDILVNIHPSRFSQELQPRAAQTAQYNTGTRLGISIKVYKMCLEESTVNLYNGERRYPLSHDYKSEIYQFHWTLALFSWAVGRANPPKCISHVLDKKLILEHQYQNDSTHSLFSLHIRVFTTACLS